MSSISFSPDLDIQLEDLFSGPFDLLLHLVRKQELNLSEIPIGQLAVQYMHALQNITKLNIDLASDFLVIAATLVEWKSKSVLPVLENKEEEDQDAGAIIMERLMIYRRFRKAANWLLEQSKKERLLFRKGSITSIPENEKDIEKFPVILLMEQLKSILPKESKNIYGRSSMIKELSLQERISEIIEIVNLKKKVSFGQLINKTKFEPKYFILSFLAILELSHLGITKIFQNESSGEIYVLQAIANG